MIENNIEIEFEDLFKEDNNIKDASALKDDDIRDAHITKDEDKPVDIDPREKEKIERIKKKISLESKRERKVNIDHNLVESIIQEFQDKYEIEDKIRTFVLNKIHSFHNDENVEKIINHYVKQDDNYFFDQHLFTEIDEYVKTLVRNALEQELKETDDEIKKEVLGIIDTHIELTVSSAGVDKLTLVAYHFFINLLAKESKEFIQKHKDKLHNISRQKTATELYNHDIMNMLANHKQLSAFTNTIISLTSSWIVKYRQKSMKLGQFINELMLMTEDVIIDKISRYIMLIALKNKNPLTLRSIMSTYISLIHRNIASLLSVSVVNAKIGYVRAVQYMYEENDRVFKSYNRKQVLTQALGRSLGLRKKKNRKKYHYIAEHFKPFTDLNELDFFEFMDPEYSIIDNLYMYMIYGINMDNSNNDKANGLNISHEIFYHKNMSGAKKYLDLKFNRNIAPYIKYYFDDEESEKLVSTKIKNFISKIINPEHYVTFEQDLTRNIDIESIYDDINHLTILIGEMLKGRSNDFKETSS